MIIRERFDVKNTLESPNRTKASLEKKALAAGVVFVEQIEQITKIPNLDFNPNSLVFVCIPVYRELENAERLFHSWNAQTLPPGSSIEIVVCINQKSSNPEDTEENTQTLVFLQNLYLQNKKANIRFHFIDNFSANNKLRKESNIGDIRNILSATVIKSVLKNPHNGVMLSTDADTFPTDSCAVELQKQFQNTPSVYGSVDKKIEFDSQIPQFERKKIKQLFLLADVHEILLEYFSSGKLTLPESMGTGGAGFFFSIDQFIQVGGYTSMDFGEDTDLLNKLFTRQPNNFHPILKPELSNTIRFSDRLEGDGALLSELRKAGFPANHSLNTTRAHAQIRRWFSESFGSKLSFDQSLEKLKIDEQFSFLSTSDRSALKNVVQNKIEGENGDKKREKLFESLLNKLYKLRTEKIETALADYATFIKNNLAKNKQFQSIFSKNKQTVATSSNEDILKAFLEFAETISTEN